MRHFVNILTLLLTSCYWRPMIPWDEDFPSIPDLGIETVSQAMSWVATHVTYVTDVDNYWQSPAQTYERGAGDCEDFSILALYLVFRDVGPRGSMVIGYEQTSGSRYTGHAWVEIDEDWWEPQWGARVSREWFESLWPAINRVSYEDAIRRSQTTHRGVR